MIPILKIKDGQGNVSDIPAIVGPVGPQGPQGIEGPQGQAGEDGFSPIASVEQTDDGAIVTITDETSTTTAVIKNGVDGKDGSQGPEGPVGPSGKDGVGVPTGGTAGQVLTKQSDTDYDTFWSTPTGGGGGTGGTNNYQDLINKPSINGVTLQGDVTTEQLGIQDGKDGQNGQDGKDGSNGYTYTPTVSPEGILSWTNNGGLPDPEPVDIRGPRGEQGIQGIQGIQGERGETGPEGFSPVVSLTPVDNGVQIDITNQDSVASAVVYNGQNGSQGPAGENGVDGVGIESITYKETDAQGGNVYDVNLSNGISYDITAPRGEQGPQGIQGPAYVLTEVDKQEIVDEVKNVIKIPVVPTKVSAFENDAEYATTKAPEDIPLTETITAKFHTSNGGSVSFGKEGPNSGTMIRLDQEDGITRLLFRSSKTKGAMVWEQPEQGAELYIDLGEKGNDYRRITFPTVAGRLVTASALLDLVYPVGSIYMSVNSTDPSTFIGGTWERVQDRFLLAAGSTYAAGATGGEATHTLTVDEMPSHKHKMIVSSAPTYEGTGKYAYALIDHRIDATQYASVAVPREVGTIDVNGGGQPHNNMPPYLAVYVWKRTA